MIQVKVVAAKYAHVFFDMALIEGRTKFYFKDNMLKYENNLKFYGLREANYLYEFLIFHEELNNYVMTESSDYFLFTKYECFIFEFDNEEEAFYFKMKYI